MYTDTWGPLAHAHLCLPIRLTGIVSKTHTIIARDSYRYKIHLICVVYSKLVEVLRATYVVAEAEGIEDQTFSKSATEILLANHLGHKLSPGGQGSDAFDKDGFYEYKCSPTSVQANFDKTKNLGSADRNIAYIRKKFDGITGVYFANFKNFQLHQVCYCSMENLLPTLEKYVSKTNARLLQPQVSWTTFCNIKGAKLIPKSKNGTYEKTAAGLSSAMKMAGEMGLEAGLFAKGGQNHLFLAQREGHTLADYGGGPDAFDGENAYEYKITMGDNFNFNYAARKSDEENEKLIRGKIRAIKGAYCAKRRFGELTDIFYIPSEELEAIVIETFRRTNGSVVNKNFKPKQLDKLGFRIYP